MLGIFYSFLFFLSFLDTQKYEPEGGTGDDECGKGWAKSEVSIGSFSGRSVSETCLEDEDAGRPVDDIF